MDVLNDKEFQLRQEDAVMEPGILQVFIKRNERHSIICFISGSSLGSCRWSLSMSGQGASLQQQSTCWQTAM